MPISDECRQLAYLTRERNAIAAAGKYPTKRAAYRAGYKVGFNRAYRAWKAYYERRLRSVEDAEALR